MGLISRVSSRTYRYLSKMSLLPYAFSGVALIGGLIGYSKGSVASLIASGTISILNMIGAYVHQSGTNTNGIYLQYLSGLMLAYVGGKKFLTKGSPIMGILGIVSFLYVVALTIA